MPVGSEDIARDVRAALVEDIGAGDLTAALIDDRLMGHARVMTREDMVLCGTKWFDETCRHVDTRIAIQWNAVDGAQVAAQTVLCELSGPVRAMLTAERAALNFLQTLSGTATLARRYALAVAGTGSVVLDTRKTIPGLRNAQKYAVKVGGCENHRFGLYDAILIKENHIAACGSITQAVREARRLHADVLVEVEVETLAQLDEAIEVGVDRVLLDNFDLDGVRSAVHRTAKRVKLEVSGGVSLHTIRTVADTGVDYISVGALTKNVHAIDLSMRLDLGTARTL